ncbi:MAG: lmo0937 family membrane protein [Bacteroidetes bacterium]|nr:lmo0937 family membrane protein [Bacteroidota bacterium]MBU1719491.1 lmo0937 family membrane protein [Bacteroidota bacterium]
MGNLLYFIAVFLVVAWFIGFMAFTPGNMIHILLFIAILAILFRVIRGKRNFRQ